MSEIWIGNGRIYLCIAVACHGPGCVVCPRSRTPVVEVDAKHFSLNMISAISNQGLLRYMRYEETMTA